MYIKDWFKPIFPLFLTSLLRKLKFLIPMVDFSPQMWLAKLRLWPRRCKIMQMRHIVTLYVRCLSCLTGNHQIIVANFDFESCFEVWDEDHWTPGRPLFTPNYTAAWLDEANLIAVVRPITLLVPIGWWRICFQASASWVISLLSSETFGKCLYGYRSCDERINPNIYYHENLNSYIS
jgi:hypothetical protein